MLYNVITSGIRTGVAALVGGAITWLISKGIEIDAATATGLIIAITAVVTGAYNALVNLLAVKVNPYFGVLLGVPTTPNYRDSSNEEEDVIEPSEDYEADNVAESEEDEPVSDQDLGDNYVDEERTDAADNR